MTCSLGRRVLDEMKMLGREDGKTYRALGRDQSYDALLDKCYSVHQGPSLNGRARILIDKGMLTWKSNQGHRSAREPRVRWRQQYGQRKTSTTCAWCLPSSDPHRDIQSRL